MGRNDKDHSLGQLDGRYSEVLVQAHQEPTHPVTYGEITISEGRKRQIRRMMKAVHCCVIELKRISIEDIILDETLSPGEWKEIFPL